MWIVMTSSAKMPLSCWGKYRNVAVVQLNQEYTANNRMPKYISTHARGVLRVRHLGHHSVGVTARSAYAHALVRAEAFARELNSARDMATVEDIIGAGGSA
jgi:hypothetical protein